MSANFSLTTGHTFTNGDEATATNLNNQVNLASFSSTTFNSFIAFDASGNATDGSAGAGLTMASGVLSVTYRPLVTTGNFTVSNSSTPTAVTGLSYTLPVGTYAVKASLCCSQQSGTGYKVGFGGSLTASNYMFNVAGFDQATTASNVTALTGFSLPNTLSFGYPSADAGTFIISGSVTVTGSGTLNVMFAQAIPGINASVVVQGSVFEVQSI